MVPGLPRHRFLPSSFVSPLAAVSQVAAPIKVLRGRRVGDQAGGRHFTGARGSERGGALCSPWELCDCFQTLNSRYEGRLSGLGHNMQREALKPLCHGPKMHTQRASFWHRSQASLAWMESLPSHAKEQWGGFVLGLQQRGERGGFKPLRGMVPALCVSHRHTPHLLFLTWKNKRATSSDIYNVTHNLGLRFRWGRIAAEPGRVC